MTYASLINNHTLMTAILAWFVAQVLKPPMEYLRRGKWNWGYLLSAGGMPSSHSALMVGVTIGTGMHEGFGTAVFALAFSSTMVVLYDATNVRREAGRHAEKINMIINELLSGHPVSDKQLREVLGHTPMEVLAGSILGLVVGLLYWAYIG